MCGGGVLFFLFRVGDLRVFCFCSFFVCVCVVARVVSLLLNFDELGGVSLFTWYRRWSHLCFYCSCVLVCDGNSWTLGGPRWCCCV